jgi:hypothetical protein
MVAVSFASPSTLSSSFNAFQNGKNWKALESIWTITGQLLGKSCDLLSSRTAGHCAMIYSNGIIFMIWSRPRPKNLSKSIRKSYQNLFSSLF